MPYLKSSFWIVLFAALLTSCEKDREIPVDEPYEATALLRSVEFKNFNAQGVYTYSSDSILQKIDYTGTTGMSVTNFEYKNKAISKISVTNSLNQSSYTYANGKISTLTISQHGLEKDGHKLVFSYQPNGMVSHLLYYDLTEGTADKLVYTSTYTYSSTGLLEMIVSESSNVKITWTIDSYSDSCNFIPWTFVHTGLSELYELYNYPVISSMKKLPASITQTVKANGGATKVEKLIKTEYTINNKRIDKSIAAVTYPQHPQNNTRSETIFHY